MNRWRIKLAFLLLFLVAFSMPAYALTASIGNARMILNYTLEKNKDNVIEKSILVKNVNNITVLVNLKPGKNLAGITEIPENNVTLEPDTQKDFKFLIRPTQPGEIEGKINVFFSDPSGKQTGVVLSSTIILYVLGEGVQADQTTVDTSEETDGGDAAATDDDTAGKQPVTVSVGGTGNAVEEAGNDSEVNWFIVGFVVLLSIILLVIIVAIMTRS